MAARPEAGPEPVAAQPELEPVAAQAGPSPVAPPDDRVEYPAWRIVAPDSVPTNGHAVEPSLPAAASAEPEWPATPQWPGQPARSETDAAFLAARLKAANSSDALWAASSRDVLAPVGAVAPAGIQSCVSCGLSLSATARFCRRCGTAQH